MKIIIELDDDDLKKMATFLNDGFNSVPDDVKERLVTMVMQASERIGHQVGKTRSVDIPEGVTPEEEKAKKDAGREVP